MNKEQIQERLDEINKEIETLLDEQMDLLDELDDSEEADEFEGLEL